MTPKDVHDYIDKLARDRVMLRSVIVTLLHVADAKSMPSIVREELGKVIAATE